MNAITLDQELKVSLSCGTSATDTYYPPEHRAVALLRATRAYSRYKAFYRSFGTGNLFSDAASGTNILVCDSGYWNIGDSIVIDAYTSLEETMVVSAISAGVPDYPTLDASTAFTVPLVTITLSSNLEYTHSIGAFVEQLECDTQKVGLQINAGQRRYMLPPDLFKPDSDSFSLATGYNLCFNQGTGYYDAIAQTAGKYNAVGIGLSYNYANGGVPGGGNYLPSTPWGGFDGSTTNGVIPRFRFVITDLPYLEIYPRPMVATRYKIDYYGSQTIGSLQSTDSEPVICYAAYLLFNARAAAVNQGLGGIGDFHNAEVANSPHTNAEVMHKLADEMYERYDQLVRRIPVLI